MATHDKCFMSRIDFERSLLAAAVISSEHRLLSVYARLCMCCVIVVCLFLNSSTLTDGVTARRHANAVSQHNFPLRNEATFALLLTDSLWSITER